MKFGESVQVAEGMALGAKWRAEMRGFDNGDAGRVVVFVEGEGIDLVQMDEHLEYEDFITMADEIVQALVEALGADRVDLTAARARLAELETASVTARGAQVDGLRRVLGCTPGETMMEAVKRLVEDLDKVRADAAADGRTRVVAVLRRKARAHERLSRMRSHRGPRKYFNAGLATYHEGADDALTEAADRIERGEA